jgi:hypothetical protein
VSEAGVEDIFDVEAIVDESIQGVLPSLAALATEAVARMDAASLVDLFHEGVGAVTAEAADRVELVEKEAGIKIGVANLLRVFSAPSPPGHLATAIELPYRLFISPNKHAAWNHSIAAVSHAGRTELWHSRMGIRRPDRSITEEPHAQRTLRAIWTPDYDQPQAVSHTDSPFRMSLTARDREMLVKVTAGYDISGWTPQPTYVHRLMLSALGGWLDTEGSWTKNRQGLDHPDVGVELEAWKHQATMGRDHYVRVVYAGFLFPFGHAASLVKVTERKFESDQVGRIAYLRQRYFIVVREPVRDFPGPRQQYAGRQFPFTQIGIKTTVTPNLGQPGLSDGLAATRNNVGASDQALFWPFVGGKPFEFELVARDAAGRQIDFTAPLIFVSKEKGLPYKEAKVTEIINAYGADTNEAKSRRTRSFSGQSVRYAPSAKAGDTDLETESITFGGQLASPGLPTGEPVFYPSLEGASVRVAALQRLLGESTSIPVRYPGTGGHSYLKAEFGSANPGEVFLEIDNTATLEVRFGAGNHGDKAGGLVTPDLSVCGLSRSVGPVGGSDIKKAAQATFDPKDFFKDATILGGLSLADIVSMVSGFDQAQKATAVPRLTHTRNGDTALTIYRWQTTLLVPDPLNLFLPHVNGTSNLSVESKIEVTGTKPPVSETKASLTNFKMNLYGFIILWFDKLEFKAVDGNKPDVDFVMHPTDSVTFGGPLEFVNKLREFIPSDGFMDPPDVDVSPTGLTASYSLGLPPIGVGMFSLENVKLGASFKLPFDGSAAIVRYNFAERHDTFILTVSALGGGGFFALATSTDGVRELESALEFGGSLSLNVGVASGGVYVKAGIYFRWVSDPSLGEMTELTGYVEVGGSLSVLGIISVSLVFYMALTYTDNGKVWGQATLIVEIEVLFFSTSVSVTVERQFKGSAGDPTFADLFEQSDWEAYCDAFVLEAAA